MDALTFTSAVIDALAWPLCVLLMVALLRGSLSELLKSLSKLKHGELELEFSQSIRSIEVMASDRLPDPQERGRDSDVRERVMKLIPISPKSAIVESWTHLEAVAIEAAKYADVVLSDVALRKPIYIGGALHQHGVIDEEDMTLFRELRRLRNEAVHYNQMQVTNEEAFGYLNTVLRLSAKIRQTPKARDSAGR